jgi:hypothetical protein
MSLAHLFDQPVVDPKPTRVVRQSLDVEPKHAPRLDLVYSGPVILVKEPQPASVAAPVAVPVAPRGKRPTRTQEERAAHRLAKKREYARTYRERQAAAGLKKKRKPYAEFSDEEKAKRRARQTAYYHAHRDEMAQKERERRAANKDRVNAANRARRAKKREEAAGA